MLLITSFTALSLSAVMVNPSKKDQSITLPEADRSAPNEVSSDLSDSRKAEESAPLCPDGIPGQTKNNPPHRR